MRRWMIGVLGVMAALAAGCAAGVKPCMVIPAQIEIAEDVREAAKAGMDRRQSDYTRIKLSMEQSQARLARLLEERDQLKKEIGGAAAEEKKP